MRPSLKACVSTLTIGLMLRCPVADTSGGRRAAARHRLAAVPRHQSGRRRRRSGDAVRPWSVAKGEGVAWKTPLPGLGLSSPVVWGNLVCLSTSISGKKDAGLKVGLYGDIEPVQDDTEHEWRVYCLDKKTGAIKWQQTVLKAVPKIKRHTKASHANSTLATDGERLIAFFGSEGLYAFDLTGKLLWKKDLGVLDAGFFMVPEAQWETGSSPVLHDNVVVVQADVQKDSFLAAFDARDGKELWRTSRTDVPDLGHADDPLRERTDADHRQRLETHRRLRLQDRQGDLEAEGRRRHPGADTGRARRADLHHERARPGRARSMPSRKPRPATFRSPKARRRTTASRGAILGTAATCARRSSTAASSTSSNTTAS